MKKCHSSGAKDYVKLLCEMALETARFVVTHVSRTQYQYQWVAPSRQIYLPMMTFPKI